MPNQEFEFQALSATSAAAVKRQWLQLRQRLYPDGTAELLQAEISSICRHPEHFAWLLIPNSTLSPSATNNSKQPVCSTENDAVGLLELSLRNIADGCQTSPVAYIESLYLQPQHRAQHIGEKLIQFTEQWAKQQGCTELASDCWLHDGPAQAFHRAMGFHEVDKVVNYRKSL